MEENSLSLVNISIALIVIGILLLVISVILLVINQNNDETYWYIWTLFIIGTVIGIIGCLLLLLLFLSKRNTNNDFVCCN
jgi:amino acid transporter